MLNKIKEIFKEIGFNKILVCILVILVSIGCIIVVNQRTDINSAYENALYEELIKVDGIDDTIAARIVENRPYESWTDLIDTVDGVGEERVKELRLKFNLE